MERHEAQAIVDRVTERHDQYKAVRVEVALELLGDELFAKLAADKIRCHGHATGYVYPWNVVDYLQRKSTPEAAPAGE